MEVMKDLEVKEERKTLTLTLTERCELLDISY